MAMWRRAGAAAAVAAGALAPKRRCETQAPAAAARDAARVTTYNVLSSHLAAPDHFVHCRPEDLAAGVRLERVLAQLREETKQGAVIGLQEVSTEWAGRLHCFFAEQGYQSVYQSYGREFNGYMGVLLAYPKHLEAVEVEVVRVADKIPKTKAPQAPSAKGMNKFGAWDYQGMRQILGVDPDKVDALNPRQGREWRTAKGRMNFAILARLRQGDAAFCVGVYHMPCLFGPVENRQVMAIHALALAKALHTFAAGDPVVLAGDFNSVPGSTCYGLLTGRCGLGAEDAPDDADYRRLAPKEALQSAYAAFHGREPRYTNFAQTRGQQDAFCETLDYLFASRCATVLGCAPVPSKPAPATGLPSRSEPSDHLLLSATLDFSKCRP